MISDVNGILPGYGKLLIEGDVPFSAECCQTDTKSNLQGKFLSAKKMKDVLYKVVGRTKLTDYPTTLKQNDLSDVFLKTLEATSVVVKKQGPAVKLVIGSSRAQEPCNSINNIFLADLTFSIKCSWPAYCTWLDRPHRYWPSPEDVQRIHNLGCHVVPKSQVDDLSFLTWRFSFSKAEVELSKLVFDCVRKCFLAYLIIFSYLGIIFNPLPRGLVFII